MSKLTFKRVDSKVETTDISVTPGSQIALNNASVKPVGENVEHGDKKEPILNQSSSTVSIPKKGTTFSFGQAAASAACEELKKAKEAKELEDRQKMEEKGVKLDAGQLAMWQQKERELAKQKQEAEKKAAEIRAKAEAEQKRLKKELLLKQQQMFEEEKQAIEAIRKKQEEEMFKRLKRLGLGLSDIKQLNKHASLLFDYTKKFDTLSSVKQANNEGVYLLKDILKNMLSKLPEMVSTQNTRLESIEGDSIYMLKYYSDLSIKGDFQYHSDRPEMRGDITNFNRMIDQEINTILNKYTTIELADKLIELVLHKATNIDDEKLVFMMIQVYDNLFEKACFEVKFVKIYAQVLVKYFDQVADNKKFQALQIRFLNAFCKLTDVEIEENKPFKTIIEKWKSFNDNSKQMEIATQSQIFAKRFIIIQRVKYEIDNETPLNPLFDDEDGDDDYVKSRKVTNRQLHTKLCMQFLSHFLCEDTQGILISLTEYMSFIHYIVSRQAKVNYELGDLSKVDKQYAVEYKKDESVDWKFQYCKQWLNAPGYLYSNTQLGFNLGCVIESLQISKKTLDKYEERMSEKPQFMKDDFKQKYDFILNLLKELKTDCLSDFDRLRVDEILHGKQTKKTVRQEIKIEQLASSWRESDMTLLDVLKTLAKCKASTDGLNNDFKQNKKNWLSAFDQLVSLITENKLFDLLKKEFGKTIIEFESGKEIYETMVSSIVNLYSNTKNDELAQICASFAIQTKITFKCLLDALLKIDAQIGLNFFTRIVQIIVQNSFKNSFEEYEEILDDDQQSEIKLLIKEFRFADVDKVNGYHALLAHDRFMFFGQNDAEPHYLNMLNHFDVNAIQSVQTFFVPSQRLDEFKEVTTQIQKLFVDKATGESIKLLFFEQIKYPVLMQVFKALTFDDPVAKTGYLVFEKEIKSQQTNKKTKEQFREYLDRCGKFVTSYAMEIICQQTIRDSPNGQAFMDLLVELIKKDKIDAEIAHNLFREKVTGKYSYGTMPLVIEAFSQKSIFSKASTTKSEKKQENPQDSDKIQNIDDTNLKQDYQPENIKMQQDLIGSSTTLNIQKSLPNILGVDLEKYQLQNTFEPPGLNLNGAMIEKEAINADIQAQQEDARQRLAIGFGFSDLQINTQDQQQYQIPFADPLQNTFEPPGLNENEIFTEVKNAEWNLQNLENKLGCKRIDFLEEEPEINTLPNGKQTLKLVVVNCYAEQIKRILKIE
ncbi:Conserved_hypothetical protein [Hexamita inflata]|uniref:Uncharacterized protein n=1 Tax=Hexamita inflata TaxID=28002 RepID=A0AA86TA31_9EUKA|nr:Conserved hypothetical protein [Hexamita inflata]